MIDLGSGALVFADGLTLSGSTTRRQLEGGGAAIKVFSSVQGREHLSLGTHAAQSWSWGVGVVFVQGVLEQVWLQCLNAERVDPGAWDIQNETIRKEFHDKYFLDLCLPGGSPLKTGTSLSCGFDWGRISSTLDLRGVQALIVVEFRSNG